MREGTDIVISIKSKILENCMTKERIKDIGRKPGFRQDNDTIWVQNK